MGYLEIRADGKKRVRLDEIDTLVIENNAVSVTGCLLSALVENKINVILCDGRRNPQSQVLPFYCCHNSAKRLRDQIAVGRGLQGRRMDRRRLRKSALLLQDTFGYPPAA